MQLIRIPPTVSLASGNRISVWIVLAVGGMIGVLSGFLGAGGGFLLIPAMLYGLGVPAAVAVGTDIVQITVSGAYGAFVYAQAGSVALPVVGSLLAGSVSLHFGDALVSGDTLFLRSVGRPDLEDGDEESVREAADWLFDSLDRLTDLEDGTVVLPGHFSDEEIRPLATELSELREETTNELLSYVEGDDETAFVETLADEPANYNEIKQINWGRQQLDGDTEALELGPNNCAAN